MTADVLLGLVMLAGLLFSALVIASFVAEYREIHGRRREDKRLDAALRRDDRIAMLEHELSIVDYTDPTHCAGCAAVERRRLEALDYSRRRQAASPARCYDCEQVEIHTLDGLVRVDTITPCDRHQQHTYQSNLARIKAELVRNEAEQRDMQARIDLLRGQR